MSKQVDQLKASLSPEEYEQLCEQVLQEELRRDPDRVTKQFPHVIEELRAEGLSESEIKYGLSVVAGQMKLNPKRGYN